MAKVVVGKLGGAGAQASRPKGAAARISGAGAKGQAILTVGSDVETFGAELTRIFGRNVARARRENKRVTGAVDRVPAKA